MSSPENPVRLSGLTKPELLALLDREIDEAHRRAQWPGWTPWALLTALAALLWGVASRVSQVTEPWIVFRSAAVTIMVIEVLRRGRQLLGPSRVADDEGRVLVSGDVLGEERPALVLEVIFSGVLLWGVGRFSDGLTSWQVAMAMLWATLIGLTAVTGLLYSAWPVPIPVGVPFSPPLRLLIQGFPLVLPALGASGYIATIAGGNADDTKLGVLVALAATVLLELAREPDEPPLAGELVDLRRAVSLGSVEVAEAAQRTTVVLRGLNLEEYVQQDARRMLRAMESLRSAVTAFRPVVDEISRQADQLEAKTVPDARAWDRLLAQWKWKGDDATRRFKGAEAWQRRYAGRLEFAAVIARFWHLPYEGQALVAEIRPKVENITTEYRELIEQYSAALARLERVMREAKLVW